MKTLIIAAMLLMTNTGGYAHMLNENPHFITDSVDIPLRSSNKIQTNPSNLLRMLPSDTKLELLSTNNGWTKVETDDGTLGWVVSRYITSTTPARVKLLAREQLIKALIMQNKKLRVELETMTNKLKTELRVL
jgi:SH3 domain protein